jgi:hypothetical protein
MGFFMGLTVIAMVAVMAMLTLMYKVYLGMIWAVVIGCATSGILYVLALWSYGEFDVKESRENEREDGDEDGDTSCAVPPRVRDNGQHGDGGAFHGKEEKAPGEAGPSRAGSDRCCHIP